jgi:hypothetical protein
MRPIPVEHKPSGISVVAASPFNAMVSVCHKKAQQNITQTFTTVLETYMHKCAFHVTKNVMENVPKNFRNNVKKIFINVLTTQKNVILMFL